MSHGTYLQVLTYHPPFVCNRSPRKCLSHCCQDSHRYHPKILETLRSKSKEYNQEVS